jgi:hypothetical protein
MKKLNLSALCFCLFALLACQGDNRQSEATGDENRQPPAERETPLKLIEVLVGEWELISSSGGDGGQPESQRLTFTQEARYIIRADGQKIDSGAYRMNEQLQNIYLESEATMRPREFELEVQGDQITLTPRDGESEGRSTRYVYRRAGPASIPPDKTP